MSAKPEVVRNDCRHGHRRIADKIELLRREVNCLEGSPRLLCRQSFLPPGDRPSLVGSFEQKDRFEQNHVDIVKFVAMPTVLRSGFFGVVRLD